MGSKPSNNFQSDRPESGGADHDMAREKSGLLANEKEEYAQEEAEKRAAKPNAKDQGFSVGKPRNPAK